MRVISSWELLFLRDLLTPAILQTINTGLFFSVALLTTRRIMRRHHTRCVLCWLCMSLSLTRTFSVQGRIYRHEDSQKVTVKPIQLLPPDTGILTEFLLNAQEFDARCSTFINPGRDQHNQHNYYFTFNGRNHFYS